MAPDDELQPLLPRHMLTPSFKRKMACGTILIAEMFERVACYGLSGTLVFFLTKAPLCWSSWIATTAVLVFTAVMFTTGLFGGWISDSYLGRYPTIILGYVIYIVGYSYLPLLTFYTQEAYTPTEETICHEGTPCNYTWSNNQTPFFCDESFDGSAPCIVTIFISIIFIAIGAGIVRTNLVPFGGDQARGGGSEFTQRFFTAYYWFINAGTIIAFLGVAVLQEWNFFIGYLVSGGALLLSLIVYLAGSKFYFRRPAGAINVFKSVFKLIGNAYSVKKNSGLRTTVHNFLDHANMEHEGGEFNVNQINDVKQLWRICKVFLLMIPYWICYSQMDYSVFLLQGLHMRLDFNDAPANELCPQRRHTHSVFSFTSDIDCQNMYINSTIDKHNGIAFPAASLAVFNSVFIVLMLPITQLLYQALTRCNIQVMTWRRIWFGMFLATLSLVAGGTLEFLRLKDIFFCGFHRQLLGNTVYDVAPHISLFWQIPQYCLLGASEVFFVVTGIEYAYMEAPINMQGVVTGLFWFGAGIGYFIGVALPYVFSHIGGIWSDSKLINCDRLDLFFYILASFLIFFSFIFILIAKFTDLKLTNVIDAKWRPRVEVDSAMNTPVLRRRARRAPLNYEDSQSEVPSE